MKESRNYVALWHDYKEQKINVLERDSEGNLFKVKYNPPYYFYVPDDEGRHKSMFGDTLTRLDFDSKKEFDEAKSSYPLKFESDIAATKRVLMDCYQDRPTPKVNYAFIDIETAIKSGTKFEGAKNPYAEINAVTVWQSWTKEFRTLLLPGYNSVGEKWTDHNTVQDIYDLYDTLVAEGKLSSDAKPIIELFDTEYELLDKMLYYLDEADIVSGWNSEFFDIPYICERLQILGGEKFLSRLNYPGAPLPRKDTVERYGSEEPVYRFQGKSFTDYMKAFQKFTFEGRTSYALGNILEEEIGLGKLEREDSFEKFYMDSFALFGLYNFRDVSGLVDLDKKFRFIATVNQMAHENTVEFDAIMGTVAYVETGITNFAHKKGLVVRDKVISEHDKVEGAIVLTPWKGLHKNIGSEDYNSLYPRTIQTIGISPEKIIGQFVDKEIAWVNIIARSNKQYELVLEDGTVYTATGAEWNKKLRGLKWSISAYGTVFDQSKGAGVVDEVTGFWYNERKRLQAEKKRWEEIFAKLLEGPEKDEAQKQVEYYDLLQLTKKIQL